MCIGMPTTMHTGMQYACVARWEALVETVQQHTGQFYTRAPTCPGKLKPDEGLLLLLLSPSPSPSPAPSPSRSQPLCLSVSVSLSPCLPVSLSSTVLVRGNFTMLWCTRPVFT